MALIIMAFYTIALSCIPCQDEAANIVYKESVALVKSSPLQQNTDHADLCSPFCICSCCASITIQDIASPLMVKSSFPVFEELHFSYTSHLHIVALTPVWQPPRV